LSVTTSLAFGDSPAAGALAPWGIVLPAAMGAVLKSLSTAGMIANGAPDSTL
jgi:hypothetical protein